MSLSQLRFKVEAGPPLHSMQACHTSDPLPSISGIPGGTLLVSLTHQERGRKGGREGGREVGREAGMCCRMLYICAVYVSTYVLCM